MQSVTYLHESLFVMMLSFYLLSHPKYALFLALCLLVLLLICIYVLGCLNSSENKENHIKITYLCLFQQGETGRPGPPGNNGESVSINI